MKLFHTFVLLFSAMVLFTGCKKTYTTGDEFTLKFNKAALIELDGAKYEFKFVKLAEESRCPPDMQCVTEGQVVIKLQVDKASTYSLGLGGNVTPFLEFADHTIQLLEVNYDRGKYGKEKYYSVKLKVD
jgi:hypothetical protein